MNDTRVKECPKCHHLVDIRAVICGNDHCDHIFPPVHGTHVDPTHTMNIIGGIYPVGTGQDGRR